MDRKKISAVITTYNEADHIDQAIQSVSWADEVILMDSFSTDGTIALAEKWDHVRIVQHAYDSPARQKNRAIALARNPWVFILDADERVGEELRKEIHDIIQREHDHKDGYWVYRRNIVYGKALRFLWRNDRVLRLIQRDRCRYRDVQVHEEIDTRGREIGLLKAPLMHYTVKDMDHYLDKTRRYARWQAQTIYDEGGRADMAKWLFKPPVRFLKHYLFEGAILDGKLGFLLSGVMAWGVWLRYVYLMELETSEKQK